MPYADLFDFLDRHQGTTTAVLTAGLVLVTVYYAIQNRQMVSEMRQARDLTILPKLALDFHRLGPTAMTLAIKNVGPGAALDVDVHVVWEPSATDKPAEHRWRRNVLAPAEQADFIPPGQGLDGNLNALPTTYERVRILGQMKDSAGNQHHVDEVFDNLSEWREVLGEARQRFVAADPERRNADAIFNKLKGPLNDLTKAGNEIARAIRASTPQDPDEKP